MIAKTLLRKNKVGRCILPDMKNYYNAKEIQCVIDPKMDTLEKRQMVLNKWY
jgi:hypothetical protein